MQKKKEICCKLLQKIGFKNEDFDQRLEYAAPKHWSKYKTMRVGDP